MIDVTMSTANGEVDIWSAYPLFYSISSTQTKAKRNLLFEDKFVQLNHDKFKSYEHSFDSNLFQILFLKYF